MSRPRILFLTSLVKKDQPVYEKETRTGILAQNDNAVICYCHGPASVADVAKMAKKCRATHVMCAGGTSMEVAAIVNGAFKNLKKTPEPPKLFSMVATVTEGTFIPSYKSILGKEEVKEEALQEA